MRQLTNDEIDRFRADGVVHVTGAVDPASVDAMTEAVDRLITQPSRRGGSMTPTDKPGMFFQDRPLFPRDKVFRGFLDDPTLAKMAADAMDSEAVRCYFEHVFVKDPGTEEQFAWHQDRPYWAVDGTQVCSSWVALTAADAESSSLEFVRGSHLWDTTFRPEFPAMEGRDPDEVEQALWEGIADYMRSFDDIAPAFEEHPDTYDVLAFAVEPGDALLFDYRVVHRSGPNAGRARRAAISWRWLGDDAIWDPKPGADPIVTDDDTTTAPGARIADDDTFPVVFGRAGR